MEFVFGYFLDPLGKMRINLHHSSLPYVKRLTEQQVLDAQKEWGDGIVAIAKAKMDKGDFRAAAENHIHTLYGYSLGPVLFKPASDSVTSSRDTFKGALSYFVAGDCDFLEDTGFRHQGVEGSAS